MKTGNGKIANLPAEIRDELNWRINEGDEGKELLEWLNAKPEVVEVVTRLFDGKPISQQNLSLWRTHGYRQWHVHHIIVQEMMALGSNSGDFEQTGVDCEKLMMALKANYAEMIQRWIITPTEQMTYRLDVFKDLTSFVLGMRRSEQKDMRLELDRERFEFAREEKRNKSAATSNAPEPSSPRILPSQTPAAAPIDSSPATESVTVPEPADSSSSAPLNPLSGGAGDEKEAPTLDEPAPSAVAESRACGTPLPSSSPGPKADGPNVESHDDAPELDAAVAGLCEAGSGLLAPQERQPATSIEPINLVALPSSPQSPPAASPEPVERAEILPAEAPPWGHPITHCSLGSVEEATPSDYPPSDLPTHPSSAVRDSSAVLGEPREEAPEAMSECSIDLSDGRTPQKDPRIAPHTSQLLSAPKPHRHRRGRRRRKSCSGQLFSSPPAALSTARTPGSPNQTISPTPAPSNQPTATAPTPPPPPTMPAPTPAIPPKSPTANNGPFWPIRQPGGPPRNASPRNPFGLL